MPNFNFNYSDLTNSSITNLFLYGQLEKPWDYADRVRPADASPVTVTLNQAEFMLNGPGRYALASNSAFVQQFFDETYGQSITGQHTALELQTQFGVDPHAFNISMQQYAVDSGSSDYGLRSYIYNTGSFKIKEDTVFVFDGANSHIENLDIKAYDDNFDFESASFVAAVGDALVLTPQIDPYGLGSTVTINIRGDGEPVIEYYGKDNYISDTLKWSNIYHPITSVADVAPATLSVIAALKEEKIIEYQNGPFDIVYAINHNGDHVEPVKLDHAAIVVGSPGDDDIIGSTQDDWLLGGKGNDIFDGASGGKDFIDGSFGDDTVIYTGITGDVIISLASANDIPSGVIQNGSALIKISTNSGSSIDSLRSIERIHFDGGSQNFFLDDSMTSSQETTKISVENTDAVLNFSHLSSSADFRSGFFGIQDNTEFSGFQKLKGTKYGDYLDLSNTSFNYVEGGIGNNTILGNGHDTIDAGSGNSSVHAASDGVDKIIFSGGNLTLTNGSDNDQIFVRKSFITGSMSAGDNKEGFQIKAGFMGYDLGFDDNVAYGDIESGTRVYDHTDYFSFGPDLASASVTVFKYQPIYSDDFDFKMWFEKTDSGDLVITFDKTMSFDEGLIGSPHAPVRTSLDGSITITGFHEGDFGIHTGPATGGVGPAYDQYDHDNAIIKSAFNNGVFLPLNTLHTDLV